MDPPIRAELFGVQRFEEHGCSLAQAQVVEPSPGSHRSGEFFPRVEENLVELRKAYDYIALSSLSSQYATPAAEWLLDNFPLIEAQLQEIREGVPRSYYNSLPKLANAPLQGLPRVYGIAWAYVAHTDSVLHPEVFTAFLNAYQDCAELRLSELWALPTTLRVVLLENLRRMANRIARDKMAREVAHAVWDSAERLEMAELDAINALMQHHGMQASYLTQLWQRLPNDLSASASALVRWTETHCPDGHALMIESQSDQVASNLTVGNIITTLRLIGQIDWVDLIEPVSRSLAVLGQLPSFKTESEGTRQQITQAMERLAKQAKLSEREVAQAVVAAAQSVDAELPANAAERTTGYYLLGDGHAALEKQLGMAADTAREASRRRWRLPMYMAVVVLATLLVVVLASHATASTGWQKLLALFLLAWPISEAVAAFVNRLIAETLKVNALARLDFSNGIPAEHRVLVVIPTLLSSVASNQELAENLEKYWLASREDQAQFALLTDWLDAPSASKPGDAELLQDALEKLATLNARYPAPSGAEPRFLLLHRPRNWCKTQRRWIGWERKRGKLEQLLRLLATGNAEGFLPLAPGMQLASKIRYVVTLDSDTGLPAGALRELVAVAAHPLNQPRVDPVLRRVVSGYGILQPRVVTPLPQADQDTPFHRWFAGQCGIDPYSSGVSDVYQDLFGTGSFSGKGLLHVDAVHAVLNARLPDDSVLSHDLLEGSIARCGFVNDVALIEEHPHHAGVAASRQHRWTRGDWQLLPFMLHAKHYGIDALGVLKMSDNLRRSLVVPASFALISWVIFTGALPLWMALLATLAALLAGPLLGALAGLVPTRRGIAWHHFFKVGGQNLLRTVTAALWQWSQLPAHALMLLDATLRALWRIFASHRLLLEWTTAAQAQASSRHHLAAFVRQHASASLLCAGLAMAVMWSPHPWAGLLIFLLWAASPLLAWWSSLPSARPIPLLSDKDRRYLETLARDTWRFFEQCVTTADNHLPPDNLQLVPEPTLAHRTSPTNIGMYLLAACCAREFGWISTGELSRRLTLTLDSVDQLTKHRGHLLNWYDTTNLAPLQPAYVSTVDSGNLAGTLLAVAQACLNLADHGADGAAAQAQLRQLAGRCQALYTAMDFSCLYDSKRHLFHIGLRVEDQCLDSSYYDLLASEARLTSFLAIAKGDVQRRHWSALGRPFLSVDGAPGLQSWSGSMFEYLMPSLLMHEPHQGLLQAAALSAVQAQQVYGHEQMLPWGISESAYFAQDHSLAYQYSPFGVPRLALRRTPLTDRVIAPYATVLATLFAPHAAIDNLQRLERLGARGELGMVEALDFTVSRQPGQQAYSVVQAYMAHHQGMSLVALCNVLRCDAPRRWFAANAEVAAYDSLLHERTPRQIVESAHPRLPPQPFGVRQGPVFQVRKLKPLEHGWKPTQLLSNGRYSVALGANGAGLSRWQGRNVSRWRDDSLRDNYGSFLYVRRSGQRSVASLTAMPAPGPGWRYQTHFMADRVQLDAHAETLSTTVTVLVSPEDDTELRTVHLHNTGRTEMRLELLSYFEAVLADPRADEAHPAFSNLFMQTRWEPQWRALILARRPRLQGEPQMAVAHFLAAIDADVISLKCATDRRTFAGRNQLPHQPLLQTQRFTDDNTPVNGLDPIASLRVTLRLAPGAIARLTFATAAAPSTEELESRIDKYMQTMHVERAARMAATLAQVRLRDLALTPVEHLALQDLTTALMYGLPRARAERATIDQRLLWRLSISGDKPIVLVRILASSGLGLVNALLRAQPWWTFGGLAVDVVVINSEPNSYLMPLQRDILALRDRLMQAVQNSFPGATSAERSSGFYLLREPEITAEERATLNGLARVVLVADGRPLEVQVKALRDKHLALQAPAELGRAQPYKASPAVPTNDPAPVLPAPVGRFHAASGEFQFELQGRQLPPRPWINIIANPGFGFQVSETGSGMTWAGNSSMHQLTPLSNDPVRDPAFEHWLLQDLDSGEVLPLTPSMLALPDSSWQVRHGQGYTVIEGRQGGLITQTTFFADTTEAIKVVQVRVQLGGNERRRLRAVAMVEWQMGDARGRKRTLQTWKEDALAAVFARQTARRDGFGDSTAFLALSTPTPVDTTDWTCDRSEFFDLSGGLQFPVTLEQRSGGGFDACGALAHSFTLSGKESIELNFLLGHADSPQAAQALATRWIGRDTDSVLQKVQESWSALLGKVQVRTPDAKFDALVNHWLLYQTVVCRLWSKAAFYQAGGASGFRDQLQDAMALALADPARLRAQILLNASRQFPEGDVQHWWHAPGGAGVRTHFSDDLLWLPYACVHYLQVTGDLSLLDEVVPFLEGAPIPEGAEDAYYTPQVSDETATLYEHCARSIERSLAAGAHGLPLMGTGDWNDGMNRVGHEGRGESVWLGWFLSNVVEGFAPIASGRGDSQRVQRWTEAREGWVHALHGAGWDGAWFRRAFFDNGDPLGSHVNEEGRIDLIAQAWSVLSGASSPAFTEPAMRALNEKLIDEKAGLLRLLDPPFQHAANNPGYIQAYPRGVRENGGQYSHAAVWAMMAQALSGDAEGAWRSFEKLSPTHRSAHPTRGPVYELEPYVMAGDIYSAEPYVGRGGWSWYTGSAAWMYRAAVETLLGLTVRPGRLSLSPRLPAHWPSVEITLKLQGHHITVHWQRHASPALPIQADQTLAWGEWVQLDSLAPQAVLLVIGDEPVPPSNSLSI